MKLKRTFRFKKIRKNMTIKKGASVWDDQCEYTTIKDSSLLSYIIAAAAQNKLKLCSFVTSEYTDEGYVVVKGTLEDFILFIADVLDHFNDYITSCSFQSNNLYW